MKQTNTFINFMPNATNYHYVAIAWMREREREGGGGERCTKSRHWRLFIWHVLWDIHFCNTYDKPSISVTVYKRTGLFYDTCFQAIILSTKNVLLLLLLKSDNYIVNGLESDTSNKYFKNKLHNFLIEFSCNT